MKKVSLFFLCILFLNACSLPAHTTLSPDEKGVLKKDKNYGFVVFSFTASGIPDVPFELLYRKKGSFSLVSTAFFPILRGTKSVHVEELNGQEEVSGKLYFFRIPVGEYEFYNLSIEDLYEQAIWSSSGKYSIPFSVESGQVLYLGNVHVTSSNLGNDVFFVKTMTSLHDRSARDIPLFKNAFPSFSSGDVTKSENLSDTAKLDAIERIHAGAEVIPKR